MRLTCVTCPQIDITFTTEAGKSFRINTTPNSWVHKNQGTRVFYATGTAYLPADTPDALKKWREAELVEIKVRGSTCDLLPCAAVKLALRCREVSSAPRPKLTSFCAWPTFREWCPLAAVTKYWKGVPLREVCQWTAVPQ
jgi:hypothetical protein